MLELVTGQKRIEHGNFVVREVKTPMDNQKTKDSYILDPILSLCPPLTGVEKFIDLAIGRVKELAANRPTMNEVVRELENILQLAGVNGNVELFHLPRTRGL
jgi:hypothetical protein